MHRYKQHMLKSFHSTAYYILLLLLWRIQPEDVVPSYISIRIICTTATIKSIKWISYNIIYYVYAQHIT